MSKQHSFGSLFRAVIVVFFSLFTFFEAQAQITLQAQQATLERVAKQISSQSDYKFFYNDEIAAKKINVPKIVDRPIEEVLDKILSDTDLMYKIINKVVYLSEKQGTEIKAERKDREIKGRVTDSRGEPLIGVGIKSENSGCITDVDGNFELSVRPGEILVFSYLGFKNLSVKADKNIINVVMEEDNELLDEVVVTALGIKRSEKALSYNVQKVDNEKLTAIKDANFINSLSGKVAGVVINSSAAGTGAASRVIMRGMKSLEKDDNALYVIDGIPMFNVNSGEQGGGVIAKQPGSSTAADINPEDIESMTILTGPSAAALYGSQASNGVILITTKRGTEGKARLNYSNSTTFSTPLMMPRFQNTFGNNSGTAVSWGKKLESPSGFNPADFFNTGVTEINSLTFTVGNQSNQTYASASSTNATGILPNNSYNRYNFSLRNTSKFLSDKFTLDVSGQYILQDNKNMVGSGRYYNPLVSLYLMPRGENFQEVRMFERFSEARGIMVQYWPQSIYGSELDMQNPYWISNRMLNITNKRRYMINGSLRYDITKWLNVVARVRVDNSDFDNYEKNYASTNPTFTEGSLKGFYRHAKQNDRTIYGDVIATLDKSLINGKLSLNINVGASVNDQREDNLFFGGGLETIPNFFHVGNISLSSSKRNEISWHDQAQSIFGNAELGWNQWLYLTFSGRNDWASQLAFTDKLSYFYPSAGLSLVISELAKLPEPITFLKIRGSWAEVASAPSRYMTLMQYSYNELTKKYEFPKDHYNTNLRPENTKSWEFGLNAKLFKSRVNLDLTLYRSNTFNQTFRVEASASSGYANNIVQTGNIQNQGIEFGLGYSETFGDFHFSTNFTYTANRNKIIKLANGAVNPETGKVIEDMDHYSKGVLGISGGPTLWLTEGGTMGDLYINQRLRQSPNGYIWMEEGKVEIEQLPDYQKIGTVLPDCNLGWSGSFGWKGLNLGFVFTGRVGGLVVSDTQAMLDKYGVSEATAKARENEFIIIGDNKANIQNYFDKISSVPGTYYTYSGTNFRLSELSLSYSLPKSWLKDKLGVTVGLTGKNLWLIYCKAPFDPESTSSVTSNFYQGVDFFQQPSLRGLGFNVKLSF